MLMESFCPYLKWMVSPILFDVLPISFAGRTVTENHGKRKKCN
jgi:hypothetical protein